MSKQASSKQTGSKEREKPREEEEEGEDDSQRNCFLCGEVPESIICLACNHSVDIPCAAKIILQEQTKDDIDITKIRCLICKEVTNLSEEVQQTLIEFLKSTQLEYDMNDEHGEHEFGEGEYGEEEAGEEAGEEEAGEEAEDAGEEEQPVKQAASTKRPQPPKQAPGDKSGGELVQPGAGAGRKPRKAGTSNNVSREGPGLQQQQQQTEVSFHFACLEHPNEEYAYYSASSRRLYCAQCLLSQAIGEQVRDLKSIKRSLPTIMHHIQELYSAVEVSRGLISNRKRDAELKLEELKAKMLARRCEAEGMFDELIERLAVLKGQLLEAVDAKDTAGSEELRSSLGGFDEKLDYLDAVQEQIRQIQEAENSEEDLLGFFFANQDKIRKFIDEENEQKMMAKLRTQCDSLDAKTKHFVAAELLRHKTQIEQAVPQIFAPRFAPLGPAGAQARARPDDPEERLKQLGRFALKEPPSGAQPARPASAQQERQSESFAQLQQACCEASPPGDLGLGRVAGPGSAKLASRSRMAELPRAQFEAERTLEKFEHSLFKKTERRKPPTSLASPEKPEDPLLAIQKKLAQFDVRAAQKRCAVLTEPTAAAREWRAAPREPLLDPRPDPASLLGLEQDRTPNIENLRNFRQKMRERYTREPIGSLRNRSIYSTH